MPSDSLNLLFTPAISAFIIAVCTTPIIIKLYQKFNLLDDPKKNKHIKVVHSKPVPRGGGTPIFLSLCIVGLVLFQLDKHFLGILFGALILTIIGILDDIYNLHPYLRLVTGTFAALCVVAVGIGIAYITNPFGEPGSVINLSNPQIPLEVLGKTRTIWVLADLFALIWILWFMNIVNWSK